MSTPAARHGHSYTDRPGLTNRANSALLALGRIIDDVSIPTGVRLVLVAQVMADEPVLTDGSVAAISARRGAAAHLARRGVSATDGPGAQPVPVATAGVPR